MQTYYKGANAAGLYTTSQVQALNVGTPPLQRNASTGQFNLTIAVATVGGSQACHPERSATQSKDDKRNL